MTMIEKTGNAGTAPSSSPQKVGPAGKKVSGKAGPGGGKPPDKGVTSTPTSSKRGQSKVGAGPKTGRPSQGPTMSANGTKQLKKGKGKK